MNRISVICATIVLLFVAGLALVSCGDPQRDIHLYGRFKDAPYTTDKHAVDCDWDDVNAYLDAHSPEEVGLYPDFRVFSHAQTEELVNGIALYSYDLTDADATYEYTPGDVAISYGALRCNSVQSMQGVGQQYFAEPMIEVYLHNEEVVARTTSPEPDYILGYRAVYSLGGELALEEGQWFLDEPKDEFCRTYFDTMLAAIGKG